MAKRFVPSNTAAAGILLPEVVEIHGADTPNTVPAGSDHRIDVQSQEEEVITHTSVNNSDVDSVTAPADHRVDVQNQEEEQVDVIAHTSVNNSDVDSVTVPADHRIDVQSQDNSAGEGPDGEEELAARVKLGWKIGIFVAGTSVAGIVPVFNSSGNYHEKNLCDKLLLGASLLFMLISFVFGVVLLQGRPFRKNNPNSIGRIKFVTGVALLSVTMVMIFGSALIIRRAY